MTATPSSPTPSPRWKTIIEDLRAELPNREYGSRFYSIADICEKFDVSSITARRVLSELQSEGLVEKIRSRGTVVRQLMQSTSVRLVTPSGIRPDYQTFSAVMRRLLSGITEFSSLHHVDFDTISESHLEIVFARRKDPFGFLVMPGVSNQTLDFLTAKNMPFVLLNPLSNWKGKPHARTDRFLAGYTAAKYLIDLGHKRIAYILGSITQRNFRDRLNGYRAALKEAKLKFDWELIQETDGIHTDQDEQAMADLLALRSPPTAVMTGDDNRAIQVLEACRRRDIAVPKQMSVLGYPNYPESKLTDPPLSVVDACFEELGTAAMKLLLSQMHETVKRPKQAIVIQPKVVDRSSTGPAPIRNKS